MQQKWWLLAVGGVGIALAVLLMPRPDTGGAIGTNTEQEGNANPLDFKQVKPIVDGKRTVSSMRRDQPMGAMGPNPIAARMMAERNTPEGMTAARMSAPWTVVRRELILSGDPDAKVFGEGLAELVVDLRNMRREPGKVDFDTLMERHKAKVAELESHSDWIDNEVITQQLTRLNDVLTAYDNGEALNQHRPAPAPAPTPEGEAAAAPEAPAAPPAQE